jgi:hypothetical protein
VRSRAFKRLQKYLLLGLRAETPANRLIKACGEKEGQRRFVIILAREVATITIECNWLRWGPQLRQRG